MTDTDKHGFTVKKRKVRKIRLLLRALLTLFVCGYALHRCSLNADAADNFLRLTLEQTLALYGTEFDVTYYRLNQNDNITCKAVYCGDTSVFTPRTVIDSLSFKSGYFYDPHDSRALTPEDYAAGGLVYALVPSLSPGGTISFPFTSWQPSSTGDHANVSIDFPVTFSGVSRFVQPVFWTLYNANDASPDRTSFAYSTSIGLQTNTACRRNPSGSLFNRYGMGLMSFLSYPRPTIWDDVPEDHLHNVGCLFADLGNPDLSEIFDITGIHYSFNNVGALTVQSEGPTDPDYFGALGFITNGYVPFIVVGCPAIYGYNPPVTTTVPTTTRPQSGTGNTGATFTQQTVDLSNLESGVAAIVQQEIYNGDTLDWIGENERRAVDNLAIIIDQLNAIYAKMWSNGEINADSGLQPPAPEVLVNFVSSALESQGDTTTFTLSGIFAPYFGLGAAIAAQDVFAPWLYVGGFVMVFAVVCWFIFYGRKG